MDEGTPQLQGITVLNLASVGPAARAARTLADYGARVIQIGPTVRKAGKQIQPPFHSYGAGRGFERIRIDLKSEAGRETFLRLAEIADVVLESYRPGVVDRLGIGFESVRARKEDIVYCSTTGYGQDGPASGWAGHDINYLAMSGFLACSEPRSDGGPPIPGATVADSAGGGMHAVLSILAALVRRSLGGTAQHLDVSAAEGVVSLMSLVLDQYLATGEVSGSRQVLLTGRYACYDVYPCQDGKWISVGAIEPHFYRNLCGFLGLERWSDHQMDDAVQDEIRKDFRESFQKRDRDEWVERLASRDTCVAPVNDLAEVAEDPHFRARGVFLEANHPEAGLFDQVGPVLAGGHRALGRVEVRSSEESDVDQVMEDAGFTEAEMAELRSSGAVE
ncbi:MAG: carnitine dehydratase [bacterium TMED88]|nr:carnitine dehydratase [Deltaproteobacteria bacterium]OUV23735.1 MAG: carnitine dehydratase [bacterium TMED88]